MAWGFAIDRKTTLAEDEKLAAAADRFCERHGLYNPVADACELRGDEAIEAAENAMTCGWGQEKRVARLWRGIKRRILGTDRVDLRWSEGDRSWLVGKYDA